MNLSAIHPGQQYEISGQAIRRACHERFDRWMACDDPTTDLEAEFRDSFFLYSRLRDARWDRMPGIVRSVREPFKKRCDGVRVELDTYAGSVELVVHFSALVGNRGGAS